MIESSNQANTDIKAFHAHLTSALCTTFIRSLLRRSGDLLSFSFECSNNQQKPIMVVAVFLLGLALWVAIIPSTSYKLTKITSSLFQNTIQGLLLQGNKQLRELQQSIDFANT